MKVLLISNAMHQIILEIVPGEVEIVNRTGLSLFEVQDFLENTKSIPEAILITDEGLSCQDREDKEELAQLLEWLSLNNLLHIQVVFLTRRIWMKAELESLSRKHEKFRVITCGYVRVSAAQYQEALEGLLEVYKLDRKLKSKEKKEEHNKPDKKRSFFDRFKLKTTSENEPSVTDTLTKELEKVSRGISRVVAITGHRGCGVTSTVVNVACEASKRGLNVMIIDMDIDYRSTNMYFSSFHESTKKDENINASLIRTLARPQDYMTTSFNLKDNLWMASLGYDFTDRKLIEQFYNCNKFVGLLSMLRNKFNLIIVDLPLDKLRMFNESLIHIDVFGLCVPNNLYSILSTLRNIDVVLTNEQAAYLNAKSKLIITKYNDRSEFKNEILTPDRVSELISSGLLDSFNNEMKVGGHVSFTTEFDSQIETDVPLVNSSKEYEHAYGSILLRLMEGVI